MVELEKQYDIKLDNSVTLDELISNRVEICINGQFKKLITGYQIADGTIQLDDDLNEKCSLQFLGDHLKYFILYPTYIEFLEDEERWNQPTLDGSIEKEACRKWMQKYLGLEENIHYNWGKVEVIYEQWIGKAGVMYEY